MSELVIEGFLFQGIIEDNDHLTAIKQMLAQSDISEAVISVAFVRATGVKAISEELSILGERASFYIGIRNGVTTVQALLSLLKYKVKLFVVDTGSINITYHPKLFLVKKDDGYELILGSANLTKGGLSQNIECSCHLKASADNEMVLGLLDSIINLPHNYEKNVLEILSWRDVIRLYRKGLLLDERLHQSLRNQRNEKAEDDDTPKMSVKKRVNLPDFEPPQIDDLGHRTGLLRDSWILVWRSRGLTERDLNIPSGSNTNRTGSMLFKKGDFRDIDQRSYFRQKVFQDLAWTPNPNPSKNHIEITTANFRVQVSGVDYGQFSLELSHNTRTDTASYRQNNSMTSIHWGNPNSELGRIIFNRNLLDKILTLYKSYPEESSIPTYLIEID